MYRGPDRSPAGPAPQDLRGRDVTSCRDTVILLLGAGWKSPMMIDRYTKATAAEQARATHARLSPADRLYALVSGARLPPDRTATQVATAVR
jgi:hypothetical protein